MKTLSKIAVIGGLLIVAGLFASNVLAQSISSGETTIAGTQTTNSGFGVRLANGSQACGGSAYWGFNHRTPEGRIKMGALLTAYASGVPVILYCDGRFGPWNNITNIYTN